jgi:hypothetical protein
VIGNGDIFTAPDAIRMMQETGCDGVMVARGAQGNPWIFDEIRAAMEGEEYCPPTVHERLSVAMEHAKEIVAKKGERVGVAEMRKHMAWYVHGVRGAAAARGRIMLAESLEELSGILGELVAELSGDFDDAGFVLNDPCPTKYDDTAEIQGPAAFFGCAGVHHTVGYLVAILDGVQLVTNLAAMEVQFSVFFAVPVVNGKTVWIALIAHDGQHTPGLVF